MRPDISADLSAGQQPALGLNCLVYLPQSACPTLWLVCTIESSGPGTQRSKGRAKPTLCCRHRCSTACPAGPSRLGWQGSRQRQLPPPAQAAPQQHAGGMDRLHTTATLCEHSLGTEFHVGQYHVHWCLYVRVEPACWKLHSMPAWMWQEAWRDLLGVATRMPSGRAAPLTPTPGDAGGWHALEQGTMTRTLKPPKAQRGPTPRQAAWHGTGQACVQPMRLWPGNVQRHHALCIN